MSGLVGPKQRLKLTVAAIWLAVLQRLRSRPRQLSLSVRQEFYSVDLECQS